MIKLEKEAINPRYNISKWRTVFMQHFHGKKALFSIQNSIFNYTELVPQVKLSISNKSDKMNCQTKIIIRKLLLLKLVFSHVTNE